MVDIFQLLRRIRPDGRSIGVYEPDTIGAGFETCFNAFQAEDGVPAKIRINFDHWPWCHVCDVDCAMKTVAVFLLVLAAFMLGQYLDQELMPQQQEETK